MLDCSVHISYNFSHGIVSAQFVTPFNSDGSILPLPLRFLWRPWIINRIDYFRMSKVKCVCFGGRSGNEFSVTANLNSLGWKEFIRDLRYSDQQTPILFKITEQSSNDEVIIKSSECPTAESLKFYLYVSFRQSCVIAKLCFRP